MRTSFFSLQWVIPRLAHLREAFDSYQGEEVPGGGRHCPSSIPTAHAFNNTGSHLQRARIRFMNTKKLPGSAPIGAVAKLQEHRVGL